jgi:anti-anti-sigma factor
MIAEQKDETPLLLAESGAVPSLLLRGTVDVRCAAELKEAALELMRRPGDVVVGCAAASRLDVTALQILTALKRELTCQNRTFLLVDVPETLRAVLALSGLEPDA